MINWFTSDTHFSHGNIIKYCNRPFSCREEMDQVLIERWNSRVAKEDTVYFLGDFCFKKSAEAPDAVPFVYYRDQLNGNIIFIQGNHDNRNGNKTALQSGLISIGGHQVYLVHDPSHMNFKYQMGFCGHVHEKWQIKLINNTVMINVGVDVWDFYPIDINHINKALARWRKNESNWTN